MVSLNYTWDLHFTTVGLHSQMTDCFTHSFVYPMAPCWQPQDAISRVPQSSFEDIAEHCTYQGMHAFTNLVWALTAFHAAVCYRKRFGSAGWNVHYDFNGNDLS